MGRGYMATSFNLLVYCLIMTFSGHQGSLLALLTPLPPCSLLTFLITASVISFPTVASSSKELYLPKPVSCIKISNSSGNACRELDLTLSSRLTWDRGVHSSESLFQSWLQTLLHLLLI